MVRQKLSLGRYTRKTKHRRFRTSGTCDVLNLSNVSKRKWTKTPIKSPYKSPLYTARQFSPAKKKVKVARPLFGPSTECQTDAESSSMDNADLELILPNLPEENSSVPEEYYNSVLEENSSVPEENSLVLENISPLEKKQFSDRGKH